MQPHSFTDREIQIFGGVLQLAAGGSAIRAMFEEGKRLAEEFGPENVFDFFKCKVNICRTACPYVQCGLHIFELKSTIVGRDGRKQLPDTFLKQ